MTPMVRMKQHADDENEVQDVREFSDASRCVITPVALLAPSVAEGLVEALSSIVRKGHADPAGSEPDEWGIVRAQTFEEGHVYMVEAPFDGFGCDRYLMDFYDAAQRDICSRMHFHTGLRFVRIHTGPGSSVRVSTLSAPVVRAAVPGVDAPELRGFVDMLPDTPEGYERARFNVVVPECSMVDMQIPAGTSHQFNAFGPHAVIDTIHPEETLEAFREAMSGFKMMAQTLFLAEELPASETCVIPR